MLSSISNDIGSLRENPDKASLWELTTHPQLGSDCKGQIDDKPILKVKCQQFLSEYHENLKKEVVKKLSRFDNLMTHEKSSYK